MRTTVAVVNSTEHEITTSNHVTANPLRIVGHRCANPIVVVGDARKPIRISEPARNAKVHHSDQLSLVHQRTTGVTLEGELMLGFK